MIFHMKVLWYADIGIRLRLFSAIELLGNQRTGPEQNTDSFEIWSKRGEKRGYGQVFGAGHP